MELEVLFQPFFPPIPGPHGQLVARPGRASRVGQIPLQAATRRRPSSGTCILQKTIPLNYKGHRRYRKQLALWKAQLAAHQLPLGELEGRLLPPVRRHQDRLWVSVEAIVKGKCSCFLI